MHLLLVSQNKSNKKPKYSKQKAKQKTVVSLGGSFFDIKMIKNFSKSCEKKVIPLYLEKTFSCTKNKKMDQFFLSFSLLMGAVLLSLGLMKLLKQPMIIGYILAGTLIALLFPTFFSQSEVFTELSQVGIVFLLFIIGTELSPAIVQKI